MSWVALQPARAAIPKIACDAVTISVSKPGRFLQRAYVTVRPSMLPDGALSWWTHSRPVSVALGQGDHAGRVRLSADGPYRTMGPTGRRAATHPNAPMLQIAALPDMPAAGLARTPARWEIVGDSLVIILPWSTAKGVTRDAAAPTIPAAPVRPAPPVVSAPAPIAALATASAGPPADKAANSKSPTPTAATVAASVAASRHQLAQYGVIERWAAERGLSGPGGFDLDAVNAKRSALGLPAFVISRRPA